MTQEEKKAYNSRYYQSKREAIRQQQRRHYLDNRQERLLKRKQYADRNRDKMRLDNQRWRQQHKTDEAYLQRRSAYLSRYYAQHKDIYLQRSREYAQRHPQRRLMRIMQRRATAQSDPQESRNILRWLESLKSKPTVPCYYCGKVISTKKVHVDHIIPVSKGGAHLSENLCAACPLCNLRKRNKLLATFEVNGQRFLPL